MFTWATACATTLGCIAVIWIGRYHKNSKRSYPLPPGPSGLPWVGNVIGIDAGAPWLTYSEWAKTYGDLVYSRLLGKDIIIINSEKVAKDLLEQRSQNYSDRPQFITSELCGADFNSALLPYGERWRLHRRFFHQTFRNDAVSRFRPLQYRKSCWLLPQLLNTPGQFSQHVFDYTMSLIMNSVYDYDPASRDDELAELVATVTKVVSGAFRPEVALIVGAFPVLLRLPSWLPGMSFKKKMAASKEFVNQYIERPFEHSVRKMVRYNIFVKLDSSSTPSMIYDSLRKAGLSDAAAYEVWMSELKGAAATAFLAGAETAS
ncbi:cytochrome P450 [Lanmaoa asiatica]|nr:cytochrome P450 [Lanmaoa asiatica]